MGSKSDNPTPPHERSAEAEDEDRRQYAASQPELDELFPNRPRNHSKTLPFSYLFIHLFNPLNENKRTAAGPGRNLRVGGASSSAKASPHEQRRHIIDGFVARWRAVVGPDFYPALRLILPDKDRDRGMYGLKESNIGKLLVKLMNIDRHSEDGSALLRWKLPGQTAAARLAGDFAGRCREVLSKRQLRSEPGDLTVADVNELLDRLAASSGEAENLAVFRLLYARMNAEEMMWLVRIVLRQLKVGATEKTFLDVWHPSAEALFSVSSSLRRVCWELPDRSVVLPADEAGVTLMQCFQPQLAQFQMPATFQKVVSHLGPVENDDEFWIEEKLDGERMQLHMTEDPAVDGRRRFRFWSRKGKDYTYLYGAGLRDHSSAMTRFLTDDCFEARVHNIILDGEMITWDPDRKKIMPFGTLKTAAIAEKVAVNGGGGSGSDSRSSDVGRPVFRVFDILFLNDADLTRYTLRDRHRALESAVRGVPDRLEIHPYHATSSPDDIEPELRRVVAESSEGLVLKNPRSPYRLGSRNDDWIKVKPEYMSEFGESLDLVIIGGYFGSGRRGGTLSSFLCGLRPSQNQVATGTSREKCWSFCKVGGGFRVEDYAEIRHHTDGKWTDWDPKRPPTEFIELAGGDRQHERPDCWIRPRDSVVIEVKAASVALSDQFAVRKTLRFPRFRRLRLDKAWDAGLDMDEFRELADRAAAEAHEREMKIEGRRKTRTAKRPRRERVIAGAGPESGPLTESQGLRKSGGNGGGGGNDNKTIFEGMEFCVLTDSGRPWKKTKTEIESAIRENGGAVTQRAAPATGQVILGEKKVVKVASLIKAGDVDVIRPHWVRDCLERGGQGGSVLPYEPDHVFHGSQALLQAARTSVDEHGDSYARDVSAEELREIMRLMPISTSGKPGRTADDGHRPGKFDHAAFVGQLEERGLLESAWTETIRGRMFTRCVVTVVDVGLDARGRESVKAVKVRNYLRFGGARVTDDPGDEGVTHVAMVGNDARRVDEEGKRILEEAFGRRATMGGKMPRVVVGSWVEMSWREGTVVDEEDFAVG